MTSFYDVITDFSTFLVFLPTLALYNGKTSLTKAFKYILCKRPLLELSKDQNRSEKSFFVFSEVGFEKTKFFAKKLHFF